jgi:glucoamylase
LQVLDENDDNSDPPSEDLRDCDGAVLFGKLTTLVKNKKAAAATSVAVTFCELATTTYGQTIKIVGDCGQLGNWDAYNAVALSAVDYTSSHPLWFITIEFAAGTVIQYKYIKVAADGAEAWEDAIPNRTYEVRATCETAVTVLNTWDEA